MVSEITTFKTLAEVRAKHKGSFFKNNNFFKSKVKSLYRGRFICEEGNFKRANEKAYNLYIIIPFEDDIQFHKIAQYSTQTQCRQFIADIYFKMGNHTKFIINRADEIKIEHINNDLIVKFAHNFTYHTTWMGVKSCEKKGTSRINVNFTKETIECIC